MTEKRPITIRVKVGIGMSVLGLLFGTAGIVTAQDDDDRDDRETVQRYEEEDDD